MFFSSLPHKNHVNGGTFYLKHNGLQTLTHHGRGGDRLLRPTTWEHFLKPSFAEANFYLVKSNILNGNKDRQLHLNISGNHIPGNILLGSNCSCSLSQISIEPSPSIGNTKRNRKINWLWILLCHLMPYTYCNIS